MSKNKNNTKHKNEKLKSSYVLNSAALKLVEGFPERYWRSRLNEIMDVFWKACGAYSTYTYQFIVLAELPPTS